MNYIIERKILNPEVLSPVVWENKRRKSAVVLITEDEDEARDAFQMYNDMSYIPRGGDIKLGIYFYKIEDTGESELLDWFEDI